MVFYLSLMFTMNWLISDTLEFEDTFENEYDNAFNFENNYIRRPRPLTMKRYLTMAADKYLLWNKLLNEMKPDGLQRFIPPRIPTTLRFG
uniref:Uncharacterized protein n=1 Tax=Schistosoma mansoni TaxID=6183 RepID=A0A3Q0KSK5_SCHMA